jgi:hypothetical protein
MTAQRQLIEARTTTDRSGTDHVGRHLAGARRRHPQSRLPQAFPTCPQPQQIQNAKHGTISTKEAAVRFTSIRHIAHIRRATPTDSPEEAKKEFAPLPILLFQKNEGMNEVPTSCIAYQPCATAPIPYD